MTKTTARIKATTMSIRRVFRFPIGVGLAVLFSPIPASAASYGVTATCTFVNVNRYQCNFPALAETQTLEIQYVSMQCGTTGRAFSLQEFQVFTTPHNSTSEVSYQIPITNQASLGGVVNTGSPAVLFAKAGSSQRALIDLTPAPVHPGTRCTASLSGVTTK